MVGTNPHTLVVGFVKESPPGDGEEYDDLVLTPPGKRLQLGRCRFEANPGEELGDGRLVFLDHVYDFRSLFKGGTLLSVKSKFGQLPLLLGYKEHIGSPFREFTADLTYDLQVFRMLFDDIDRALADETTETRELIRRQVIHSEGLQYFMFFDQRLEDLESLIASFTKLEHERHGFYFRRQVWDVIMSSAFLARTNLRPRGYAGDSMMMQQIYNNDYVGDTIFARLMHKHPIESAAAQAVRNRRLMIPKVVADVRHDFDSARQPIRFMSVACGPACELRDLLQTPADVEQLECVLLDQDQEALDEAQSVIEAVEKEHRLRVRARIIRDSVRTMLRSANLADRWGRFHLIYTMGLFDYLNQPVARAVLTRLYDLLLPGGRLIVGNFHVNNPTRQYMAYWMDWTLIYRTENGFRDLAADLAGAEVDCGFEDTRSQMFLTIRKPA
ncbi:MAG: class I SAM-dependent methyltransferase [bacterium]